MINATFQISLLLQAEFDIPKPLNVLQNIMSFCYLLICYHNFKHQNLLELTTITGCFLYFTSIGKYLLNIRDWKKQVKACESLLSEVSSTTQTDLG